MNLSLIFRKRLPQFNSVEEIFLDLFSEFQNKTAVKKIEMPKAGAGLKDIIHNLRYTKKNRSAINHVTGHVNYVSLGTGSNTILTIHDIGSALQGNLLKIFFIKIMWFWLPAIVVEKITVISEFSKQELCKLVPFARKKIVVIHNPVNSTLQYCPKPFNSNHPLVLHIGTKPNKNLERTIMALEGIKCTLLVVGSLSENQVQLLKKHRISYTNKKHLPFSEIKAAYEACDLVSFVSLYEGFGMPVIEAQAVGRPILTSTIEPIMEVAGKGACLVNPESTEEIRAGFMKIINDEACREELVMKGRENVKRFHIDKIAAQYLQLYKEVANV